MTQDELTFLRVSGVIEAVNLGILIENEDRQMLLVNTAFLKLFNIPIPAGQFLKFGCDEAAVAASKLFIDELGFLKGIEDTLSKKLPVQDELLALKDGRFFEKQYTPFLIEKKYHGHAWIYSDVTNRIKMTAELEELASTDELTRVLSRRAIHRELNRQVMHFQRHSRIFSIAMLDVDYFKKINDTYGHHAGDAVLKTLCSLISSRKRSTDFLGRWGGEEFLIILPETALKQAGQVINEYCSQIARLNFGEIEQNVTASFGVVQISDGDTEHSLLQRCDEALYLAKDQGRNRVVVL